MTLERGNAFTPVASATMIWPWGTALVAGGVTGAATFLLNLTSFPIGDALTTGIFFFSLVGGAVALLGSKGDRRARRYAGQYPWRFASAPALIGGAGSAAVTLVATMLTGGFLWAPIAAIGAGIGTAAVLWVILGIIGMVAGNKSA